MQQARLSPFFFNFIDLQMKRKGFESNYYFTWEKQKFFKNSRYIVKIGYLYKISRTGDIEYLFILYNDLLIYGKFNCIK